MATPKRSSINGSAVNRRAGRKMHNLSTNFAKKRYASSVVWLRRDLSAKFTFLDDIVVSSDVVLTHFLHKHTTRSAKTELTGSEGVLVHA